jgi:hypothetical protein
LPVRGNGDDPGADGDATTRAGIGVACEAWRGPSCAQREQAAASLGRESTDVA